MSRFTKGIQGQHKKARRIVCDGDEKLESPRDNRVVVGAQDAVGILAKLVGEIRKVSDNQVEADRLNIILSRVKVGQVCVDLSRDVEGPNYVLSNARSIIIGRVNDDSNVRKRPKQVWCEALHSVAVEATELGTPELGHARFEARGNQWELLRAHGRDLVDHARGIDAFHILKAHELIQHKQTIVEPSI